MAKRIVVALGGNALGKTAEEQLELVKETAKTICDLKEEGYEVVVGHGNGPQVGMINLAMEYASSHEAGTPPMPFPECGAMSQGYIGYHLQQAVHNEMIRRNLSGSCVCVVTQVVVDENDAGFKNPTKPIGNFYTEEEAEAISREKGYVMKEDAGRGYRRVVASPLPKRIVELEAVKTLAEAGNIVITVGGGGVPVFDKEGRLEGAAAVIDKDRSCALLAQDMQADVLLILTAVDKVSVHFKKEDQIDLDHMSPEEAERYMKEGEFAAGSMLPKVEACCEFVKNTHGTAIITSLMKASLALDGKTGTVIS